MQAIYQLLITLELKEVRKTRHLPLLKAFVKLLKLGLLRFYLTKKQLPFAKISSLEYHSGNIKYC